MHRQCFTLHCNNNCCKQDNVGCKVVKCKNYLKDSRKKTCTSGPSKGFVQNLKDKLVNLQNESQQYPFSKRPIKKKQKDYYCIMLSKINNLDKKLQNLELLFTSHLNHTQHEVFNSSSSEPPYDYMNFYESVRSLADLATRLKEDILYKQCDKHTSNRNSLHFSDRIQLLDSELQNLYTYLDQLENCTNERKGSRKRFSVQDRQDVKHSHSDFTEDFKEETKRFSDFNEIRNPNREKKNNYEKYKKKCSGGDSLCHCIECFDESDEGSSDSCQCSRCKLSATACERSPRMRTYSPEPFGCCQRGSITKCSNYACNLCMKDRKQPSFLNKKNRRVAQSLSSCSCEICESNKWKSHNKNCNSAKILRIIKPKKDENEENGFEELQVSFPEMKSFKSNTKRKQKNKKRYLNKGDNNQDIYFGTTHSQVFSLESKEQNLKNAFYVESKDSRNINQSQNNKITPSQYPKTIPPSQNQETGVKNVVFFEVTPDINILTKRKNNRHVFNNTQENYRMNNKNAKISINRVAKDEDKFKNNRLHTANFNVRDDFSNKFPNKTVVEDMWNSVEYRNDWSSLDLPTARLCRPRVYEDGPETHHSRRYNQTNNSTGKHLHIKVHNKKRFEDELFYGHDRKRSPEHHYKHKITRYPPHNHRKHDGICHFQNGKFNKRSLNKKHLNTYPYHNMLSESDSFETVEEYESDTDSCSSQYKLFFCNDPDCFEKLDSDELIMLMKQNKLKNCGREPHKLNVITKLKDLKSDICEKCTIKEKTIAVTPYKNQNKNNYGEEQVIYKKEIIECSNCKNSNNNKLGHTTKTNVEYFEIDSENDEKEPRLKTNSLSNSHYKVSNTKISDQKKVTSKDSNYMNNNQEKNKFSNKNHSKSSNSKTSVASRNKTSKVVKNDENDIKIVAQGNVDQNTPLKISKGNSAEGLEVPGSGNLININIERGSYSPKQQLDTKIKTEGTRLPEKASSANKNSGETTTIPNANRGFKNLNSSNTQDKNPNLSRDISDNKFTQSFNRENTSRSVMDLGTSKEKDIIKITNVKSEILNKSVGQAKHVRSKATNDIDGYLNKNTITSYAAKTNHGMDNEAGSKRPRNNMNMRKNVTINYFSEENPKGLHNPQGSRYLNEERHRHLTPLNNPSSSNKSITKPRLSLTKIKNGRLKYNKKFGSSLSKVSSVSSIRVQQAKLYSGSAVPYKRSSVFNPGRRSSQLPKHRLNGYPRIFSRKENPLSRAIKPTTVLLQESYLNNFKNPSNCISNPKYKVESISNYLSSSLVSESSYSTLDWEKVAEKLKVDDNYFNDIA